MSASELNKILYVEDDPDIRQVAIVALEAVGGFQLEVCTNGAEAVARGEAFSPDLILLDVMMPGMDGPETLTKLRKIPALQSTPAIFMTAKVMPSDVERYKALGAIEVVSKPFDPVALPDQLRKAWMASQ